MSEDPDQPVRDPAAEAEGWAEEVARPLVAPTKPPDNPPQRAIEDPWAHRRGEPRIFALAWTIFLFAATGVTMLAVVARGFPGRETMQPAARVLMMTVAAGIVLVWPLVRLSQRRDERPVFGMVHDLVVVLVPVQAIVWPQTMWWLGRWPVEVVGAVALEFVAWGLLIGGMIALAYASESRHENQADPGRRLMGRAGWMAVIATCGFGPALLALAGPHAGEVRWWWMLSPITAIAELTRDRSWSGVSAQVRPAHWWMILATAGLAAPLWAAAAGLNRRGGRVAGRAVAA